MSLFLLCPWILLSISFFLYLTDVSHFCVLIFVIFSQIEAITEGFESNTTARQVLSQLVNATKPVPENDTKRPPEIFGGDLVIAVDVLVTLAGYNSKQGNVSTEEDTENFAQVASNLLESTNRVSWLELEKVGFCLANSTLCLNPNCLTC